MQSGRYEAGGPASPAIRGNSDAGTDRLFQLGSGLCKGVPPGPEGRDFRYRSYEDLQADGFSVDRKNYQLVYTAPLDKDTTLDEIYRRFNIEHPVDYKGHSLSKKAVIKS